jgi:hypothetical protein
LPEKLGSLANLWAHGPVNRSQLVANVEDVDVLSACQPIVE